MHHNEVKIGMEILTRLVRNPPCTWWQQVEFLNQVVDVLTPLSQVEVGGVDLGREPHVSKGTGVKSPRAIQ